MGAGVGVAVGTSVAVGAGVAVGAALAILAVAVGTAVASISGSALPPQPTNSISAVVKRSSDKSLYSITNTSFSHTA